MPTHIALIRGINVGTGKRVAMAQLRAALADRGFERIRTLLNSGNVVLESDAGPDAVADSVSDVLATELQVSAEVIVQSPDQVIAAMAADPFGSTADDGSKHFIGFPAQKPQPGRVGAITELRVDAVTAPDLARLIQDHLYLWCPNGISRARFALNWDKALGTPVTIRNWNTVTKLVHLAG